MQRQAPEKLCVLLDFDNTICSVHSHDMIMDAYDGGKLRTKEGESFSNPSTFTTESRFAIFGHKVPRGEPNEWANIIQVLVSAGHKVGIITFSEFPDVIPLYLERVLHLPSSTVAEIKITTGLARYNPNKNNLIQQASEGFDKSKVIFVDDSETNIKAAKLIATTVFAEVAEEGFISKTLKPLLERLDPKLKTLFQQQTVRASTPSIVDREKTGHSLLASGLKLQQYSKTDSNERIQFIIQLSSLPGSLQEEVLKLRTSDDIERMLHTTNKLLISPYYSANWEQIKTLINPLNKFTPSKPEELKPKEHEDLSAIPVVKLINNHELKEKFLKEFNLLSVDEQWKIMQNKLRLKESGKLSKEEMDAFELMIEGSKIDKAMKITQELMFRSYKKVSDFNERYSYIVKLISIPKELQDSVILLQSTDDLKALAQDIEKIGINLNLIDLFKEVTKRIEKLESSSKEQEDFNRTFRRP